MMRIKLLLAVLALVGGPHPNPHFHPHGWWQEVRCSPTTCSVAQVRYCHHAPGHRHRIRCTRWYYPEGAR